MKKIILYLPEKNSGKPNACSFLRMISPLSVLVRQTDCIVEELVSLSQLFKPNVIALTTNRTAFLDLPGLSDLIVNGNLPPIQLHWDTDDYSGLINNLEPEAYYLQRLSYAQRLMETHATILTASTKFIQSNALSPAKWHVVRNSLPFENWNNKNSKDPSKLLFFGLNVHRSEIERLSEAFDNIGWARLKKSKISIEIVGNFPQKFNQIFRVTQVPPVNTYYPRFASWLTMRSSQLTGLVLIEDSILNKGKSALKFLEYSAMGMATAGYGHAALETDLSSASRYHKISRENPAEDLLTLISEREILVKSSENNYLEVHKNRRIESDRSGMYIFYLQNLLALKS